MRSGERRARHPAGRGYREVTRILPSRPSPPPAGRQAGPGRGGSRRTRADLDHVGGQFLAAVELGELVLGGDAPAEGRKAGPKT